MILIKNRQKKYTIDLKAFATRMQLLLDSLGYTDFDVGIWFTTNKTIARYNTLYRHKSGPTDILSFSYHTHVKAGKKIVPKGSDDRNLGDIIISLEYVYTHKRWQDVQPQKRLDVLMVHGLCHLLGYDHETDADYVVMNLKEQSLLKLLE